MLNQITKDFIDQLSVLCFVLDPDYESQTPDYVDMLKYGVRSGKPIYLIKRSDIEI